ncbi:MAG: hypothetical protein V4490_04940 [Pseudomonadota bacterium]
MLFSNITTTQFIVLQSIIFLGAYLFYRAIKSNTSIKKIFICTLIGGLVFCLAIQLTNDYVATSFEENKMGLLLSFAYASACACVAFICKKIK